MLSKSNWLDNFYRSNLHIDHNRESNHRFIHSFDDEEIEEDLLECHKDAKDRISSEEDY